MYIVESLPRPSLDLELGLIMKASLYSIYGTLGNTVRHVRDCTFTNSVLVTLGGRGGGAVAVVHILRPRLS